MSNFADNGDIVASNQTFEDAIAEGARFDCAELTDVTFRRCDLYWASFFMTRLVNVTFEDCDMRGADFKDSTWTKVQFINCDVGTDAIGGETQFDNTDLSSVNFKNCRGR